jgi:DNA-binding MarR family transcriptional regulator
MGGVIMSGIEYQADRLQRAFKSFIRSHQFRDRNEMSPFGVTVTQCYAIDTLGDSGGLTMSVLAERMYLTTATMTGVVNELVKKGLAERKSDPRDRRLIRVVLTDIGQETYERIRDALLDRYTDILGRLDLSGEDVEKVISVLNELTAVSRGDCSVA